VGVDLLPFLALSVLLILIPGPDTAVVTKNALMGGRRAGVLASIGVSLGLTIWTLAAALGIAALLRASAPAFLALKLAGAVYLVWIGVQMLRARALASRRPEGAPRLEAVRSLRQGLLSDLGNPKIAVFFTSFLPQFTPAHHASFLALVLLGLLFCAIGLSWLTLYVLAISRIGDFLRRPKPRRILEGFTGIVLVGFGLRLAAEHR